MNQVVIPQFIMLILGAGLFLMMLGVALEVRKADWLECLNHPASLIITVCAQIIGVPLLALLLVLALPISDALKLGIIMISLCPGGVVSNFFSLRAGGNPALSSITTLISSSLVPFTLPLGLFVFILIQPNIIMLEDTSALQTISITTMLLIIPSLILGLFIRKWYTSLANKLMQPLRSFSLGLIAIIIVFVLFNNRNILAEEIAVVFPMTFVFNALLLGFGFWLAKALRFPTHICRTISLELGIQNIGVALLTIPLLFPNSPTVLNIAAFWGMWHLIAGLAVSQYWKSKLSTTSST